MAPSEPIQPSPLTVDKFFTGYELSRLIYLKLTQAIDAIGSTNIRITKSQVAFRHRTAFAWAWIPAKYLGGKTAPLVLSIALPTHDPSSRWKEVVEPHSGRFIHHLELYSVEDIDKQVLAWLTEAWLSAG